MHLTDMQPLRLGQAALSLSDEYNFNYDTLPTATMGEQDDYRQEQGGELSTAQIDQNFQALCMP